MSTETDQPIDSQEAPEEGVGDGTESTEESAAGAVDSPEIESPEFQEYEGGGGSAGPGDLKRIQKIQITVSAELGRAEVPIQQLMTLAEGSVVELDRDIDSPVELYAQGVALAAGEVLVVDGHFAIRILNVYDNK